MGAHVRNSSGRLVPLDDALAYSIRKRPPTACSSKARDLCQQNRPPKSNNAGSRCGTTLQLQAAVHPAIDAAIRTPVNPRTRQSSPAAYHNAYRHAGKANPASAVLAHYGVFPVAQCRKNIIANRQCHATMRRRYYTEGNRCPHSHIRSRSTTHDPRPTVISNHPRDCPIADSLGRAVAAPVTAALSLPPFTASAMDGYANRSADLNANAGYSLRQIGTS